MILSVKNLKKSYRHAAGAVEILKGVEFDLDRGETLAIVGPSGCGKSTLLALLAGLDRASSGTIRVDGQSLETFSENDLTRFRAQNLGIVFQQFYLMNHLTALENVCLPLEILGFKTKDTVDRAKIALNDVGLSHRFDHMPNQLSGGECQRVAIARALVVEPKILLADEPSGNLDEKTGHLVTQLLFDLVLKKQTTLILVTHHRELAQRCKKMMTLDQGLLL